MFGGNNNTYIKKAQGSLIFFMRYNFSKTGILTNTSESFKVLNFINASKYTAIT